MDGWITPNIATRIPAREHGHPAVPDGTARHTAIVLHVMQGHKGTMDHWAQVGAPPDRQVSYHFGVSGKGRASQYVSVFDTAWHAGRLDRQGPAWAGYKPNSNPNHYAIGVAVAGFSSPNHPQAYSPTNPVPDAAMRRVKQIVDWCFANVPSLGEPSTLTIIRHSEIAPLSRGDDPGPYFPMDQLRAERTPDMGITDFWRRKNAKPTKRRRARPRNFGGIAIPTFRRKPKAAPADHRAGIPELGDGSTAPYNGRISEGLLRHVLKTAGWDEWTIDDAVRVVNAESNRLPKAHNDRGEDSYGLFQINAAFWSNGRLVSKSFQRAHGLFDVQRAFDPYYNAKFALAIYRDSGWKPWAVARGLGLA